MDDTVATLGKGSRVWYRFNAETWLLAELREASNGGPAAITLLTGAAGAAAGSALEVPAGALVPANPALQQAIPDLTQLSYLNEPSILDNLSQRYKADNIYTNAGPVLIAVNPCRNLPLYTPEVARTYKAGAFEAVNQLAPHIYLVAGAAFRDMVRQSTSQSLVINGESGAGKTETTKKAMQFFAALAGGTGVEDQVLETNPILESFGNAKTLRNHNSSRFGKLIEIHFNKTNHICGARIRTYLLEKSRVVHQLKGERSFHIFYQLVRGAKDKAQRTALKLPNKPSDFVYLSKSGCMDIDGVDDADNFREVLSALRDIGLADSDVHTLLSTLSGILWLGNLRIEAVHADDSSRIKADAALANAAGLLGLGEKELAHAITHKKIKTRDELIVKPLTAQEANDARDALAKALYSGVFNWIVAAINAKLDMGKKASGRFIAILDIYGFEQFTVNSFEQLCINYANERLQQQFTRHLFTLEQEEYESEGIDWTKVEWVDNQACVDVIEAMPPRGLGVLAVLDSQCRFPKGSDDTFMMALRDSLAANDHFGVNPRRQDEFCISHYAGPVAYNAAGFLDKNKDMLNADLVELLQGASSSLVNAIGGEAAAEMDGKRGGQTVSSRFTGQLKELVAMLDATGLHFVRCIKPNAALAPGQLSLELVLQQLRCCGVLEVARVSRAGFPTRYRHADFVSRYKILLPPEQQGLVLNSDAQTRAAVRQLLGVFKVPDGQFEMGRTKVFFKPGVLGYVEDTWAKMHASVLKLQAFTRMRQARARYDATRSAALLLQSAWRARAVRLTFGVELRRHKAATTVQRCWRGHVAATRYQRVRAATRTIQAGVRRAALNRRVAARTEVRLARERAEFEAREEVRRREEGFDALKAEYGVSELSEVRRALACYAAMRSELDSRDPSEVADALALLGVVRRAGGGRGVAELTPAQIKTALQLSAACEAQLGPGVEPKQLNAALAAAAACHKQLGCYDVKQVSQTLSLGEATREKLGGLDIKQLQQALAAAVVCKQALGSYDQDKLASALATAQLCHKELGRDFKPAALQDSLALAAAARKQLGGGCEPAQLAAALAAAALCAKQLGSSEPAQVEAALAAAAVCSKEAGSLEPQQLKQRLVMAESARQQLGSLDERQLAQSLAAAALCRQVLGEHDQRQLHEALGVAALARDRVGGWDQQQLLQRLALADTASQHLGGCDQQAADALAAALAAAAVCKQQLGSYDAAALQQQLALADAATKQLGSSDVSRLQEQLAIAEATTEQLGPLPDHELQAALASAVACREQLGSWDTSKLQRHLSVARTAERELGSCDEQQVQAALATAHMCKERLGSLDQRELQRHLSVAEAAAQELGSSCDEQHVHHALALAATCEQTLGTRDEQQIAAALDVAAACREQLGGWDQQLLAQRLALAAAADAEMGGADEQQLLAALAAAAVCKQQLGSYDREQLQERLVLADTAAQQLGCCDEQLLQQQLVLADAAVQQLGSCSESLLQQRLAFASVGAQALGSCDEELLAQRLALADAAEAQLDGGDQQQLAAALATAAVCKQQLGSYDREQLQQRLALADAAAQQLGGCDEQALQQRLALADAAVQWLGSCDRELLEQQLALADAAVQQLGRLDRELLQQQLAMAAACQQAAGAEQLDADKLQQQLGVAKVVVQQLNGSSLDPAYLRTVLQLGQACQHAGLEQPAQLNGRLQLAAAAAAAATPEDVAAALALQRAVLEAAGPAASCEQVASALALQAAAEEQGIADAGGLSAALAAAATTGAAAVAARESTAPLPANVDRSHVVLGSVVAASGVTDPDELQTALSTYRHLRPALAPYGYDPRHARRACSMYAAAVTHGIADKRDFMAAAALYSVLREDNITSAGELRLAVAMYSAVREEGILDPEDLHWAIALASVARDEGLRDPADLAAALAASRPGGLAQRSALLTGGLDAAQLGSLRATGGLEAGEGGAAAALQAQVAALQAQLESEKVARSKYARQLEQQAVEWMGQVKLLKEYIDSLRAKMPPNSSAGGMPSLSLPHGGGGGGSGRRGSDPAMGLLAGLDGDWSAKAPLFDDDASFIREVVDGEVLAPDMQVQLELDRLRKKYEAWNRQFKERLREAQAALRRKQQQPPGGGVPMPPAYGGFASAGSLASQPSSSVLGVPGVVPMVSGSFSGVDSGVAVTHGYGHAQQHQQQHYAPPGGQHQQQLPPVQQQQQQALHSQPQQQAPPTAKERLNVRRMPDLTAPDLLAGEEWADGSDGGRKKRGLFRGLLG